MVARMKLYCKKPKAADLNCWHAASPFNWVDSDGSGLVQALGNDNIAEGAIQPGHLDHIKALISPVNISYESTWMQIRNVFLHLC